MSFTPIHNRLEIAVIDAVKAASVRMSDTVRDNDALADAACIALNALPARYIRHDVDASCHMSDMDLARESQAIAAAVKSALTLVQSRRNAGGR